MAVLVISYSRADQPQVRALVSLLSAGLRDVERAVYWDEQFEPGEPWFEQLKGYIDASPQLFVFWCAHSQTSPQVRREFSYALATDKRVVPVLLDDTPLVAELEAIHGIDLRGAIRHGGRTRAAMIQASAVATIALAAMVATLVLAVRQPVAPLPKPADQTTAVSAQPELPAPAALGPTSEPSAAVIRALMPPLELDRSALTREEPAGLIEPAKAKLDSFYERYRDVRQRFDERQVHLSIKLSPYHANPESPDISIEYAIYQYFIDRYNERARWASSDPAPTDRPRTVVSVDVYVGAIPGASGPTFRPPDLTPTIDTGEPSAPETSLRWPVVLLSIVIILLTGVVVKGLRQYRRRAFIVHEFQKHLL
jgi:hypothetical protein